jgi:hypothetical protein
MMGATDEDFCIIHGRKFMHVEFGNPIPYCAACESSTYRREVMPTIRPDALFLEMEAEITRLRNCLASIIAAYDRAQEQDEEFGSSIGDEAAMDAAREEISTGSG